MVLEAPPGNLRLDVWLAEIFGKSRSQIQNLLKDQRLVANGQALTNKSRIKVGDKLEILKAPDPDPLPHVDIVYQDKDLIVINKPAGLCVHPGAEDRPSLTLVDWLKINVKTLSAGEPKGQRPGIVHRLDQGTSGLLVCAKNDDAHEILATQFKNRQVKKEYFALVVGHLPEPEIRYVSYLYRNPKNRKAFASTQTPPKEDIRQTYRKAISTFKTVVSFSCGLSLVKVGIETGRTHQIRVHAKALAIPLLGDSLYGSTLKLAKELPSPAKKAILALEGQLLHARTLTFVHPTKKQPMLFKAKLGPDFQNILRLLMPFRLHAHAKMSS